MKRIILGTKYIHVDQDRLRQRLLDPLIIHREDEDPEYASVIHIEGPSLLIFPGGQEKMHGARIWLETGSPISYETNARPIPST